MDKEISKLFAIFIIAIVIGSAVMFVFSNTIFAQNGTLLNNVNGGSGNSALANQVNGFQEINMTVDYGWKPGYFVVKKGVPVKWNIYVKNYGGCINGLSVPSLNIYWRFTQTGERRTIESLLTKQEPYTSVAC
jgi:plastocyanin domain-containing protein